ncbi:hypothetical protein V8F06_008469 [Rhypophila decipiens]
MASQTTKPGYSNPPLSMTTGTTSVQEPLASNPTLTTATETTSPTVPEKSNLNPPQTTAPATTSAQEPTGTASESTSNNTHEPSTLQPSNQNGNDASSNRRLSNLSDRALPPLPQDQTVEVPNRVINDSPPPEYMSLNIPPGGPPGGPNNNPSSQTQRSGPPTGPGSSTTRRPENYATPLQDLNESPDYVDCPHCRTRQKTTVRHEPSTETTMAAVACCLCCGILPGLFPFCCQWFYDVEHVCPRCVKVVARMPHDGKMEPVLPPKYQPSQFQPPVTGSGNTAR